MGVNLKVEGLPAKLDLSDYRAISFKLKYTNKHTKFAKSDKETLCVEIKGNIDNICQHNPQDMDTIRKWAEERFQDKKYYKIVTIDEFSNEEFVRKIIMTNAYLDSYEELVDPYSGMGVFIMIIYQQEYFIESMEIS